MALNILKKDGLEHVIQLKKQMVIKTNYNILFL